MTYFLDTVIKCVDGRKIRYSEGYTHHVSTDVGECDECNGEGCRPCDQCLCVFPRHMLDLDSLGNGFVCEDCNKSMEEAA